MPEQGVPLRGGLRLSRSAKLSIRIAALAVLYAGVTLSGASAASSAVADILFSTHLGSSHEVAAVADGTLVVAGTCSHDRDDVCVKRLSGTGAVLAETRLGGSNADIVLDVAVDRRGNAYVTGVTSSEDFPVTFGAAGATLRGTSDAFVVQLAAADLSLSYATYLGGSGIDYGRAIDVDFEQRAYLAGSTQSTDFPVSSLPFQGAHQGGNDAFVARLNADGTEIEYATYLGGSYDDIAHGIAVLDAADVFVVGSTRSADFPTTPGALDTSHDGGAFVDADGFAVKLDMLSAPPQQMVYGTYFGGQEHDQINDVVARQYSEEVLFAGQTLSADLPVSPHAFDTSYAGQRSELGPQYGDAFVASLSADGSRLGYATYLGGAWADAGTAIAADRWGFAYIGGLSRSSDFPVTAGAFQTIHHGGSCQDAVGGSSYPCPDGFLVKLSPDGDLVPYSTFIGGSDADEASGIALSPSRAVIAAGPTRSSDFPLVGAVAGVADSVYPGFTVAMDLDRYQAARTLIGTDGGTLFAPDGSAEFAFGSDSFASPAAVTYRATGRAEDKGGRSDVGIAYHLEAIGEASKTPVDLAPGRAYRVTLHYDPARTVGIPDESLALHCWDGHAWVAEPSSRVDTASETITASPSHLSTWAVLGPPRRIHLPLAIAGSPVASAIDDT